MTIICPTRDKHSIDNAHHAEYKPPTVITYRLQCRHTLTVVRPAPSGQEFNNRFCVGLRERTRRVYDKAWCPVCRVRKSIVKVLK